MRVAVGRPVRTRIACFGCVVVLVGIVAVCFEEMRLAKRITSIQRASI